MSSVSGQQWNKRKAPRRRTRLRSGKVAAMDNRFITDCLIFDRSCLGVRLRLAGRGQLPEHVKFFDDELDTLHVAKVIWQRGNEAGLAFAQDKARGLRRGPGHAALAGKYYALRHVR